MYLVRRARLVAPTNEKLKVRLFLFRYKFVFSKCYFMLIHFNLIDNRMLSRKKNDGRCRIDCREPLSLEKK